MKQNHAINAAIGLILMVTIAPIIHFWLFPSIIDVYSESNTIANLKSHLGLFWLGIIGLLFIGLLNFWVASSLRKVTNDVNPKLAYRAYLLRIFYALVTIFSLYPLIILGLGNGALKDFHTYTLISDINLIFIGIYLIIIAYLVAKAINGSRLLAAVLFAAGFSYIITSLLALASIKLPFDISIVTIIGRVLLIIWLLMVGRKGDLKATFDQLED